MPGLTRSECASWVQAWGSIIALGTAVGIAWHQSNAHDRREAARLADEHRRQLHQAMVIARGVWRDAQPVLDHIDKANSKGGQFVFPQGLESAVAVLQQAVLLNLPPAAGEHLDGMRAVLHKLETFRAKHQGVTLGMNLGVAEEVRNVRAACMQALDGLEQLSRDAPGWRSP